MEKIGEKTKQVWNFIADFLFKNGYPPTVREIACALGFKSTSAAVFHLNVLERKNYLRKKRGASRSIELLAFPPGAERGDFRYLPLIGSISAGKPIEAIENIEAVLPLPRELAEPGCFLLQAKGDSMKEKGIFPGDLVIVKPQKSAESGEIVVAFVEGEATVKTWRRKGNRFWLEPANPFYQPIPFKQGEIIGKVIGLIRKLS